MKDNQEFLIKLKTLLQEYNASIEWTCNPCSDMHGVTGEAMSLLIDNKEVHRIEFQSYLTQSDL
jgi:hypothetical protein